MQEVGVVEDLVDNKGFSCPVEQAALIDEVPGAPGPLILGTGAVWVVEEAAGVKEQEDSRTASLHSSLAMRVCNLSIELPESAKAAEKLDIASINVRERLEHIARTTPS